MALPEYKIKVVDASNKPLLNFPMATRYVGNDKKNNKLTSSTDGVLTFQSDGRAVEVFVLAPIDKNGQPDMTKFKEDNDNDNAYFLVTTLNVLRSLPSSIKSPYFLTDYGIAKTKFIFYENEQDKKIYSVPLTVKVSYLIGEEKNSPKFIEAIHEVKNGELNITSILHSRIQVHPFKPDNTPFKTPQGYTPRSTTPVELSVYFDIKSTDGKTDINKPKIDEKIEKGLCACNRDITLDDLKKIAVGSKGHLSKFLAPLNTTLKLYEMNTCIRKAYFIAQTFLESSEYKLLEESGISAEVERINYRGYKGRGLIQITYPEPYIAYGKYKGVDFTGSNRSKIATPLYALDSAGWFWTKFKAHNLNNLADKNDLIGVSAVINGGFNHFDADARGGIEHRKGYLLKAFEVFNVKACDAIPKKNLENLNIFNFETSIVYNMVGESFGWGLWHDPALKKQGCTKSAEETKKGYLRFLELSKTKKFSPPKRYGYTMEQAKALTKGKV